MKLDITFEESNQRIDVQFAEAQIASDGGFEKGYEQGYTEGNENGYKEGYSEAQEETASLFGIQNEVKGTSIVTLDYVNENEHNVVVKLSSDTVTDFSGVEVKCIGKNCFNSILASNKNNWIPSKRQSGYIEFPIYVGKDNPVSISYNAEYSTGLNFYCGVAKSITSSITWLYNNDDVSKIQNEHHIVAAPNDCVYIRCNIGGFDKFVQYILDILQVEVSSIKTEFKPYTEKTYTANADGTVDGVTSISPNMNIICEGVDITAKYCCVQDVEWHRFWDSLQTYGQRTNYAQAFTTVFPEEIFKPKYDIIPANAYQMFGCISGGVVTKNINKLPNVFESGAIIDFSKCSNIEDLFKENRSIQYVGIIDTRSASNLNQVFARNYALVEIEKIILKEDCTQTFTNTFAYNEKLESITFEGIIGKSLNFQWSSLLTVESAKNIIQCLANYKGTTSDLVSTITFHADVWALLDEEGNVSPNGNTWRDYIFDLGWNLG